MTLRLVGLKQFDRSGEITTIDLSSHIALLTGPRNSSKTTTLRMIDYCFGDDDSARAAFGPDVSTRYAGVELEVELPTGRHTLRRSFTREFGSLTRIQVDDDQDLDPRQFSDWIMQELGWPSYQIPRGRIPELATDLVPLSFRTLWRHVYRKEGSWLEFANQEQEFHRRAVLAFFLGLAGNRYSNVEFEQAAAERRVKELEEQLAALDRLADETVQRVAQELGLPATSTTTISQRDEELRAEAEELEASRQAVGRNLQASEGFVSKASNAFDRVSQQLAAVRIEAADLRETLEGYRVARSSSQGETIRLARAASSVELIAGLPVTLCPVCGQTPPHPNSWPLSTGRCYLCDQQVVADVRDRRIHLEEEVVRREIVELDEIISRTDLELRAQETRGERLAKEREKLGRQLDQERQGLLAPFVAELEEISRRIGAIEQQRAALAGLGGLLARRSQLVEELDRAYRAVDAASVAVRRLESFRAETHRRCSAFAARMSEFLMSLESERWQLGRVAIAEEELAFYVGGGPWEVELGAESKILFLLSYHYALLHLTTDLGDVAYPPGLAVLDNPLQQGIGDAAMAEALDRLFGAAIEVGAQVIATLPHAVALRTPSSTYQLTTQYGSED